MWGIVAKPRGHKSYILESQVVWRPLNQKGISCRRNKSLRKRGLFTVLWGIVANPGSWTVCFLRLQVSWMALDWKGISCRRRICCFEKKRATASRMGVSFQSPEATQLILWGPKSYGPTWTQGASSAGVLSPLKKGVTHSRVGYHCKAQRLNNLFLGVPQLMNAPRNPTE